MTSWEIYGLQGRRAAVAKPGSEAAKKAEDETKRQQPAVAYRQTRHKLPRELVSLEAGVLLHHSDPQHFCTHVIEHSLPVVGHTLRQTVFCT